MAGRGDSQDVMLEGPVRKALSRPWRCRVGKGQRQYPPAFRDGWGLEDDGGDVGTAAAHGAICPRCLSGSEVVEEVEAFRVSPPFADRS